MAGENHSDKGGTYERTEKALAPEGLEPSTFLLLLTTAPN